MRGIWGEEMEKRIEWENRKSVWSCFYLAVGSLLCVATYEAA